MANNYTRATLTPDVRLTDELRAVLEITGASLEPADDGEWYAVWEDGINELDDDQTWGIPQYLDAAEAAAFRDRWLGKDIADVLRAVLASNPGTGMLVIEGAYGSSKMRAGEFGGFGIYVTREQSAFISSRDVVMQDGQLAVTARVQERAAADDPSTPQEGPGGILLTPAQLRKWTGMDLTPAETARLARCIPGSSIPVAIGTIVTEAMGLHRDDEDEDD